MLVSLLLAYASLDIHQILTRFWVLYHNVSHIKAEGTCLKSAAFCLVVPSDSLANPEVCHLGSTRTAP